jgi:hypothetical protein
MGAQATVTAGGLDISVIDFGRATIYQPGDQIIDVRIRLTNPAATDGAGRFAPDMELQDGHGNSYGLIRDYRLAAPVPPGRSIRATQHFIVGESSADLRLVISPGSPEEAVVQLIRRR